MMAVSVATFELAARFDLVGVDASALRANGLAIGFRPAHLAKRVESGVFTSLVNVAKAERPGFRLEQEVGAFVGRLL